MLKTSSIAYFIGKNVGEVIVLDLGLIFSYFGEAAGSTESFLLEGMSSGEEINLIISTRPLFQGLCPRVILLFISDGQLDLNALILVFITDEFGSNETGMAHLKSFLLFIGFGA